MAFPGHPRTGVGLRPGDVLLVLHDFNARTSDELTLRKSERVELIEMDDGFGDGWYLGRHLSRGGTGLFPGVYTTKAPSTVRSTYSPIVNRGSLPPQPLNSQAASVSNETTPKTSPIATPQVGTSTEDASKSPGHGYSHSRDSTRSSLPASYTSHAPAVQRSIGETLSSGDRTNEDSPVMNETLSVIDEHITDLSTPRQSLAPPPATINEDSESEYSRDLDRQSYVAGPETDDEENERLTEANVRKWDHKKTAQYLRSAGVDPGHCDIFEEQEITGDVLLDMDQSFIHMKEYNFGVMGRRLKTWHKVRELQEEVKSGHKLGRKSTFSSVDRNSSADDMSHSSSRLTSNSTLLPRIPSLMEKPGLSLRHSQGTTSLQDDASATPAPLQPGIGRASFGNNTPPSPWRSSMVGDGASRPSAAMIRELAHSRRHSSVDYNKQSETIYNAYGATPSPAIHQNKGSMDRGWTMSSSTSTRDTPQFQPGSVSQGGLDLATSPQEIASLDLDDRGYFSGNEVDKRLKGTTLRKREGEARPSHARRASNAAPPTKRHTRLSSMDSIKDSPPSGNAAAAKAYHSSGYKGRLRSASARGFSVRSLPGGTTPPAVTNLEKEGMVESNRSSSAAGTLAAMHNRAKKFIGIRAASENLSQPERIPIVRNEASLDGSTRASPVASPTGSTTPSQNSRSLDYENTDSARKAGEIGYAALPKSAARARAKGKQETSAYTRGLLKMSPEEARKTCDYHGWMKKKSSSLMTTWKPRLFILRGCRLSYYYSESDTEERGIIDISGHKVLVANNDAIVTLHAQITGATSPATNPSSTEPSPRTSGGLHASSLPFYRKIQAAHAETRAQDTAAGTGDAPSAQPSSPTTTSTPFYFKLIPPKSGFSRAVQFTKPAVHFFQVDSITEGRKWMGELMKATIEHDWSSLETTNKQKTISLAKARARGERPKALLGDDMADGNEASPTVPEPLPGNDTDNTESGGLNISGLDFERSEVPPSSVKEKTESKTDSGVGEGGDVLSGAVSIEEPKT